MHSNETVGDQLDPRPRVVSASGDCVIEGGTCSNCGRMFADRIARCRECRAETRPTTFGPLGTVWSSTVVRIEAARVAPYALAYVTLAAGPRMLAHIASTATRLRAGQSVKLVGTTAEGDALVEVVL